MDRRPWPRPLRGDVAAPPREDGVDGRDAVDRARNVDEEHRLHQPGRGHQEGGVGDAARRRDDLAAAAVDGERGDGGVEDLELDIAHRLVAERPLAAAPLEALQNEVSDGVEQPLVHLGGQRVVGEHVGPLLARREAPHRARRKQVPVVPLLEKLAELLTIPVDGDGALLDVLSQALLERLGDHRQLRLAVGRLGEALERRRLNHRLAKSNHGVGYLHLHLGVDVAQIVHHAVEIQLASAHDHVLARLLNLGREQRVGLVQLAQAFQHLWQLRRVERLSGDLHHGDGAEVERPEDARALRSLGRRDGARLDERRLDALNQRPAARRNLLNLDAVPRLVDPEARDDALGRVLLVLERVRLAEHVHRLPNFERAAQHATKRVKRLAVWLVVHLGDVDHEEPIGVAVEHVFNEGLGERARVGVFDLCLCAGEGRWQVGDAGVDEASVALAEEAADHELEQRLRVELELVAPHRQAELDQRRLEVLLGGRDGLRDNLVKGLEDELHKRARTAALRRLAAKGARGGVQVDVAPQPARHCGRVEPRVEVGVDVGVRREGEAGVEHRRGEDDRSGFRREARVRARRGGGDGAVHLLKHLTNLEVGVLRRQLELEHEPVDLVDAEHDGEALLHRVLDEALAVGHQALDHVHHEKHAVGQTKRRRHLV
mmetsp:Transcript_43460/g.95114  ORF Transcript_43460/g.95114 Transcript_43460/m.95114 type:complete len:659 (+) Transcript_43460:316-2292(+)